MSETLVWNLHVAVTSGPQLADARTHVLDGYDKFEVTVTKGKDAMLNTGAQKWSNVSLLVMKPSIADPKLTYKTGDRVVSLDGTQILAGAALSLLGDGPADLEFSYDGDAKGDITVHVLVGRNAG